MALNLPPYVQELAKKNPDALASIIDKMPLDYATRKQIQQIVQEQIRITIETNSKIDAVNQMYLYSLYKLATMLKNAEAIKTTQLPIAVMAELELRDQAMRATVIEAVETLLTAGVQRIVQGKKER